MCLSVFTYSINDTGVSIRFLNMRVRHIPYTNIEEVYAGSKGKIGEVWTVFKLRGLISIKKKKGWLRYATLAPSEPGSFSDEVREKCKM